MVSCVVCCLLFVFVCLVYVCACFVFGVVRGLRFVELSNVVDCCLLFVVVVVHW